MASDHEAERAAALMWSILRPLRYDERELAVAKLGRIVCLHCGFEREDGRPCQCQNDE